MNTWLGTVEARKVALESKIEQLAAERDQLKAQLDDILEPVMEAALEQIETHTHMESEGDSALPGGVNNYEVTEIIGPDYITFDIENDMNIPTSFNGTKNGADFQCLLFEIVKGEAHYEVIT